MEDDSLKSFWRRRNELTVEENVALCGVWAIVPETLREKLLKELHLDHPGMSRMKTLARAYMWWPGLDADIETLVRQCGSCLAVKSSPPTAPLNPWVWPSRPWKRVHLDFAGPFQGSMFFIAVDAHSKWPEVHALSNTTVQRTLESPRQMFAAHGLPSQIVTDNGPQFVSQEFAVFMKNHGIKHVRSAPYHPASNGLAERFIQTFKQSMKATVNKGFSANQRLSNFLLTYRSTPHATTGVAPCMLLLKRQLCTRFDLLRPDRARCVESKQAQQKSNHDSRSRQREFVEGQSVMARNLRPGDPYVQATVISKLVPVTYMVKTQDGQSWKRHIEQLKDLATSHSPTPVTTTSITDNVGDVTEYPTPEVHDTSTESSESAEITQAQPDSVETVNETPQVLEALAM